MFRIDKSLVNLSGTQEMHANMDGEKAGASGSISPNTPAYPARAKMLAEELINDAETKAAEIIEAAQAEAKMLLAGTKADLERERENARNLGYSEGVSEANAEYEAKLKEDDNLVRSVLNEIQGERAAMLASAEGDLTELALEIARKIIGTALEIDDSIFNEIIKTALRKTELEGKLTLRVSPAEYERFFAEGSAVFNLSDEISLTAAVIKDTTLGDGGLIIDTEESTIDAGVDTQLRLIQLAFEKTGVE